MVLYHYYHMERPGWSLTQAARALGQQQHRLIYLCEQGVVSPDLQDARGRGSSRLFSERNLLEFAVVLRLRELQIPVWTLMAIVHVLRAFEERVRDKLPDFKLPDSLLGLGAPDLRIIVGDGRLLYASLGAESASPRVFGPIDLKSPLEEVGVLLRTLEVEEPKGNRDPRDFGGPEGSRHWRVEISVTRVARDLKL